MNETLRETLAQRAHSVDPPRVDVAALVAHGEKLLRHRRLAAVAGSVLAVALAVGVPAVVMDLRHEPRSVEQPKPPAPPEKPEKRDEDIAAKERPLVYVEGSVLHVGEKTIDLGNARRPHGRCCPEPESMVSLHVTDEGAVFPTFDGRIWFSDGSSVEQIGTVPAPEREPGVTIYPHGSPESWIETDDVGSGVAWLEYPSEDRARLVVYDTARSEVRARLTLPVPPGGTAEFPSWDGVPPAGLYGDRVYWYAVRGGDGPVRRQLMRTVVSTGTHARATRRMLLAELYGRARTLVVGRDAQAQVVTSRNGQAFQGYGSLLEAVRFDHDVTNANYAVPVFDPVSGERLRFRAPAGLGKTDELVLFQWLDDDRFVLSTRPRFDSGERRDIVVCRVSTQQCEITVRKKPGRWLMLPEVWLPG